MSKQTLELIADGGLWITVITLFTFSVVNIGVISEKIIFFRKNRGGIGTMTLEVRNAVANADFTAAKKIASAKKTPESTIISEGITFLENHPGKSVEILPLELTLENAIARERVRIERNIWALGTIGTIGPLVGLFGTVLGIMRAFAEISMRGAGGQGVVEVAAGGIWESLYTTAFGILVAVPALIAYNYFVKRSRIELDMLDNAANDMIAIATEQSGRKSK
jgi:biopolymer transport protein ExbB/TolQ